MSHFKELQMK